MRRAGIGAAVVTALAIAPAVAGATQPLLAPYLVMPADGAPVTGSPVVAEPGVWDVTPGGFRITWQRCAVGTLRCADIDGAGGAEYRPVAADLGSTLRALVRPIGVAGATDAATATSPVVVAGRPAGVTATPSPGGAAGDGPADAADATALPAGLASRLRLRFGTVAELGGVLLAPGGGTMANAPLELRDPAGAVTSVGRSGTDGAFRVAARFTRPGTWTLAGDGWRRTVEVELRPAVRITAVTRSVRAPGVVHVTGRVRPGVAGKLVQLQYLDPGRGWRLWQQVTSGPGGRFALARLLRANPLVPRFTLSVRVAVPADVGWPYAPAVTRTLAVRVG